MALQKTIEVLGVRYTAELKRDQGHPMDEPHCLWIDTMITIDDPEDTNNPHLPIRNTRMYRLYEDSDVSQEPQLVQDLWHVIFTHHGLASGSSIPKIGPDAVQMASTSTPSP